MKKLILLLLTLTLLTFPACSGGGADIAESESDTEAETLVPVHHLDCDNIPQTLASEIKLAYFVSFIHSDIETSEFSPKENVWIPCYYGNHGGYEIVYVGDNVLAYPENEQHLAIAGYVFGNDEYLYAYKDGTIALVKDVYENGNLTKQDIYNIGKAVDPQFTEKYPNP